MKTNPNVIKFIILFNMIFASILLINNKLKIDETWITLMKFLLLIWNALMFSQIKNLLKNNENKN